jgi:hypothetical protein
MQAGLEALPIHSAVFSGRGDKVYVGAKSGRVRQYNLPSSTKLDYHADVGALPCAVAAKVQNCTPSHGLLSCVSLMYKKTRCMR